MMFILAMPSSRILLLLARLPPIDTLETAPLSKGRVNRRVSVGTIPGAMRAMRYTARPFIGRLAMLFWSDHLAHRGAGGFAAMEVSPRTTIAFGDALSQAPAQHRFRCGPELAR